MRISMFTKYATKHSRRALSTSSLKSLLFMVATLLGITIISAIVKKMTILLINEICDAKGCMHIPTTSILNNSVLADDSCLFLKTLQNIAIATSIMKYAYPPPDVSLPIYVGSYNTSILFSNGDNSDAATNRKAAAGTIIFSGSLLPAKK